MKKYLRIRISFYVFIMSAAIFLFGMSGWQMKRHFWKKEIIANFERNVSAPIQDLYVTDVINIENDEYKLFNLSGHFLNEKTILLGPRYKDKKQGFHILTPIALDSGEEVLVNRGYISKDNKDLLEATLSEYGAFTVMLKKSQHKRRFIPGNSPAQNFWFIIDVPQIGETLNLDLGEYYFEVVGDDVGIDRIITPVGKVSYEFFNEHFNYAITWFLLGVVALVVGLGYNRTNKE